MHFVCYISIIACVEKMLLRTFTRYFLVCVCFIILVFQLIMVCRFVTKLIFYRIFFCFKKTHPFSLIQISRSLFCPLFPQSTDVFHQLVSFLFQCLSALILVNMHCFSKGIKALALFFLVFRLHNAAGVILFVCVFSAWIKLVYLVDTFLIIGELHCIIVY